MKFLRDSLTKKAILLFSVLLTALVVAATVLFRQGVVQVSLWTFVGGLLGLLLFILVVFLLDVMAPLGRVAKEVRNLLGGRNYQRVAPTTIDEIGMFTHFFNEITRDLEKISYDVRERRRMTSELDIAAQIQRDVLPKSAPESKGLDIVAKTRPATEIGGDSFDFLKTADGKQTIIYIGDVTGHGVPSGIIMMMVNTLIRSMLSMGMVSSKDITVLTNTLLAPKISSRLFMTLVMLRWDAENQKMYYTGAGHEHILVYRQKTEKVEAIRSGGIALGMIDNNSMIAQEKEIDPALQRRHLRGQEQDRRDVHVGPHRPIVPKERLLPHRRKHLRPRDQGFPGLRAGIRANRRLQHDRDQIRRPRIGSQDETRHQRRGGPHRHPEQDLGLGNVDPKTFAPP
jgi:Fe2+ transport system protein FeoA